MEELTPMQAAYWVGRRSEDRLGGVSAHLYAEFDGHQLDANRLRNAVRALCRRHPMLGLRVDDEGRQHLDPHAEPLPFDVEDLRGLPAGALAQHLAGKRRVWTHRTLDLTKGQAAAFGLSLMPGGACRLHVDTDMIAIDPNSFRIVMENVARLYQRPDTSPEPVSPGYFDWLEAVAADAGLAKRRGQDRAWWRERIPQVAPAPVLPAAPRGAFRAASERLSTWLAPAERRALRQCACHLRVTLSALALGLFAVALGRATGMQRFRLNVPSFWRAPVVANAERIVGEFSNTLIFSVDLAAADTLAGLCREVGRQLMDLLAHSAHPGVSVMRDLSRHHGAMQTTPVVFTAGLGIAGGELFDEVVGRALGHMNWVISQGPHVAIDAQVAAFDGGILVNWDVRLDTVPETWIRETFDAYVALLRESAASPGALDAAWQGPLAHPAKGRRRDASRSSDTHSAFERDPADLHGDDE